MYPALPQTFTPEERGLFSDVDQILIRSVSAGDPLMACEYGLHLQRSAKMRGVALAKLLHGLQLNWEIFRGAGIEDDFEDFIDAHMGVTPATTRRYMDMWLKIFLNPDISDETKEVLKDKSMQDLLLLRAAVAEGSLVDSDLRIAALKNTNDIREMIREKRGEVSSSKNAIHLILYMRDDRDYPAGSLVASQNGDRELLATINLEPETEFGKKGLARLLNAPGVMERN